LGPDDQRVPRTNRPSSAADCEQSSSVESKPKRPSTAGRRHSLGPDDHCASRTSNISSSAADCEQGGVSQAEIVKPNTKRPGSACRRHSWGGGDRPPRTVDIEQSKNSTEEPSGSSTELLGAAIRSHSVGDLNTSSSKRPSTANRRHSFGPGSRPLPAVHLPNCASFPSIATTDTASEIPDSLRRARRRSL
jgi:hypothetical protein